MGPGLGAAPFARLSTLDVSPILHSFYLFFCFHRAVWVPPRLPSVRWVRTTTPEAWMAMRQGLGGVRSRSIDIMLFDAHRETLVEGENM